MYLSEILMGGVDLYLPSGKRLQFAIEHGHL